MLIGQRTDSPVQQRAAEWLRSRIYSNRYQSTRFNRQANRVITSHRNIQKRCPSGRGATQVNLSFSVKEPPGSKVREQDLRHLNISCNLPHTVLHNLCTHSSSFGILLPYLPLPISHGSHFSAAHWGAPPPLHRGIPPPHRIYCASTKTTSQRLDPTLAQWLPQAAGDTACLPLRYSSASFSSSPPPHPLPQPSWVSTWAPNTSKPRSSSPVSPSRSSLPKTQNAKKPPPSLSSR